MMKGKIFLLGRIYFMPILFSLIAIVSAYFNNTAISIDFYLAVAFRGFMLGMCAYGFFITIAITYLVLTGKYKD